MQETNISINEIIMYLRKSRSDDPYMTMQKSLPGMNGSSRNMLFPLSDPSFRKNGFSREVVSGETIADRPVMQSVMKYLESGQIKGVLVIEPQRLSVVIWRTADALSMHSGTQNTLVLTPPKT